MKKSSLPRLVLLGGALLVVSPVLAQVTPPTTPINAPLAPLAPPSLRRDTGTWLFNDSNFVAAGQNIVAPGGPTFVPNLRRDRKAKLPLLMPFTTGQPLKWSTLPLPSLRDMASPAFSFATLQTQLANSIGTAKAQGQLYIGFSLPSGLRPPSGSFDRVVPRLTKEQVDSTMKQLRPILDAVAPDAALILDVDVNFDSLGAVSDINLVAPYCDAIVLNANDFESDDLWTLKMARRTVEEQKDFDLPIFVNSVSELKESYGALAALPSLLLERWMGGATGFILRSYEMPGWAAQLTRNTGLWSGAVTLEDAAVLPTANPQTLRIIADLRASGRIPLVGRLPEGDKNGESLFAVLDDKTTLENLNAIDKAARGGASLYLEGLPDLKNKAVTDKLAELTGTVVEVLPTPRSESLALADPWLFGTARGREMPVTQTVKLTFKTSLATQVRNKQGEDSPFPRAGANLATDPNGLIVSPLGKGRLIWLPHSPTLTNADSSTRRIYYAAIAGSLQGSLVSWRFPSLEDETRNNARLRVALRASKAGTPIIAIWNDADTDAQITLSARGDAPIALDLSTEKEIPATVRDYQTQLPLLIPAHGWRWVTFGQTRAALDKERLAPRPKAKTAKP